MTYEQYVPFCVVAIALALIDVWFAKQFENDQRFVPAAVLYAMAGLIVFGSSIAAMVLLVSERTQGVPSASKLVLYGVAVIGGICLMLLAGSVYGKDGKLRSFI